jgi:hypothetical protein
MLKGDKKSILKYLKIKQFLVTVIKVDQRLAGLIGWQMTL